MPSSHHLSLSLPLMPGPVLNPPAAPVCPAGGFSTGPVVSLSVNWGYFSGDGHFLFFLAHCLCFRAWGSRAHGGMWGASGLPGQVGTELGPLPAVTDCPWKEPHEEEVRPVWLTPQQRHWHREHTGGAGEEVGGAGWLGLSPPAPFLTPSQWQSKAGRRECPPLCLSAPLP